MRQVLIFHPALGPESGCRVEAESGNQVTAARIGRHFEEANFQVELCSAFELDSLDFRGGLPDLFIGLHLLKSHQAVEKLRRQSPGTAVVLVSTGTDLQLSPAQLLDLYPDCPSSQVGANPTDTQDPLRSLGSRAQPWFVTFHAQATQALPERWWGRTTVIPQSVEIPRGIMAGFDRTSSDSLKVVVASHLRRVKDPLLIVQALKLLPVESRIQAQLFGAILEPEFGSAVEAAVQQCPRFSYGGSKERMQVLSELSYSYLCVLSSLSEGQPGILLESIALGTPVLCSKISGNQSVVGADYPGQFECGDYAGLAELLLRAERDQAFYRELSERCRQASQNFSLENEREAWLALAAILLGPL